MTKKTAPFIPVILSGGKGSRLWPLSRANRLKSLIRFNDGESLYQKTLLRAMALPDVVEVMTVLPEGAYATVRKEACDTHVPAQKLSFLLEPVGRNTAAAIAGAALLAVEQDERAVLFVLPSDHMVSGLDKFSQAAVEARKFAEQGHIAVFGVPALSAETGYGYIEAQENTVLRFIEKPDKKTAEAFFTSGKFLWNVGMFCFEARTMIAEMKIHCPEIIENVRACVTNARRSQKNGSYICELPLKEFSATPATSVDKAVIEKSDCLFVVPCDFGWSDLGAWDKLCDLLPGDDRDNRGTGDLILHDVSGCCVYGGKRLVGLLGVKDLVVVDTPEALLVADINRAQDVGHLYMLAEERRLQSMRCSVSNANKGIQDMEHEKPSKDKKNICVGGR